MERPCQCLWLKIGAVFLDYDWFCRSALWRVFLQIFTFSERPILHYFWEVPLVPGSVRYFFVLRVTYLFSDFSHNGLFVITSLSSRWIVRNWSRVLLRYSSKSGHMPRSRGCFLDNGNKGIALRWDCTVWQKVPVWLDCSGGKVPGGVSGR